MIRANVNFFRLVVASWIINFCIWVCFPLAVYQALRYFNGVLCGKAVISVSSKVIEGCEGRCGEFVIRNDFSGLTRMLLSL